MEKSDKPPDSWSSFTPEDGSNVTLEMWTKGTKIVRVWFH